MGGKYADARIVCPYFIAQDGQLIKCQGAKEGMSDWHYFRRGNDKRIWTSIYCTGVERCRKCPYYKIAERKEARRV